MMALTSTDLPELVVPAMSRCGIAVKSAHTGLPATSLPKANRKLDFIFLKASVSITSRNETRDNSELGTSMPTYALPGTGAWIRMLGAESANARSSARLTIFATRTRVRPVRVSMNSGSTPYWVTAGPRWISTMRAGAPKEASVSSMTRARSRS